MYPQPWQRSACHGRKDIFIIINLIIIYIQALGDNSFLDDLEGLGDDSEDEDNEGEGGGRNGGANGAGNGMARVKAEDLDSLDSDDDDDMDDGEGGGGDRASKIKVEKEVPDFEKILHKISGKWRQWLMDGLALI